MGSLMQAFFWAVEYATIPTAIDTNLSASHGRASSRPSTSLILLRFQDVDTRDKRTAVRFGLNID